MSDRIVAELLGWTPHPTLANMLLAPLAPGLIRRVCHFSEVPYTVDDLLTWLADEGWCTDLERLIGHKTPVIVTLRSNDHTDIDDLPMFTTALAACEAAVRAVAEMP